LQPWIHDFKSLPDKIGALRHELRRGRGFVVIRNAPVEEYATICSMFGAIVPQTVAGATIYSVRDEGLSIDRDYGRPGVRISKTSAAFPFHTDSPSRLAGHTPDYIGLYVVQTAKSGGESLVVNGYEVEAAIRRERPDVLDRLYRPFWVDRRAELPPGEEPVVRVPVFSRSASHSELRVNYLRLYIAKGQELQGEPLHETDIEALDFFDSVMNRPGLAVSIQLQQHDIQIINNTCLLHSRTAYEDHPEPEKKRHYLRIWICDTADPEGRKK
jgi:alpha-ketoglutarate-dependent taurine dioxygenase